MATFFELVGLKPLAFKETNHGAISVGSSKPKSHTIIETYQHPGLRKAQLQSFQAKEYYIKHSSGDMTKVDFLGIDAEDDVILKDYVCPDCHVDDDGCDHCELEHLHEHTCDEAIIAFREQYSDLLFQLLKWNKHGPAKPGLFVVHDGREVSIWTRSGVAPTPIIAPKGTKEGQYFF
jgi:hypothetical protein